jgi:hypothetical protein
MLESINNSLLKIRSKIYAPLVKEKVEVMKYEIKGIGITEAIEVYKKEVQIKIRNYNNRVSNSISNIRFYNKRFYQ